MPRLEMNFDEVPDKVPPFPPGLHEAVITETPTIEEARSGKGNVLRVVMRGQGGEVDGRMIFDSIPLWTEFGKVKVKHLAKSAGVEVGPEGLELEDLEGLTVRIQVVTRTYKDDSDIVQEVANVRDYVVGEKE